MSIKTSQNEQKMAESGIEMGKIPSIWLTFGTIRAWITAWLCRCLRTSLVWAWWWTRPSRWPRSRSCSRPRPGASCWPACGSADQRWRHQRPSSCMLLRVINCPARRHIVCYMKYSVAATGQTMYNWWSSTVIHDTHCKWKYWGVKSHQYHWIHRILINFPPLYHLNYERPDCRFPKKVKG